MSFIKNFFFPVKATDPTQDLPGPQPSQDPLVEGKFTPRQLSKYNGHDDPQIFISVNRTIYDVSKGRQFYGPSGPYANFAGHDASRGLALNSFEFDVIKQFDEPIDDLKDLSKDEIESLQGWEDHFKKKYPIVGQLIDEK